MEQEERKTIKRSCLETVADFKTPLSKEVRSTSKMVNGRTDRGTDFP